MQAYVALLARTFDRRIGVPFTGHFQESARTLTADSFSYSRSPVGRLLFLPWLSASTTRFRPLSLAFYCHTVVQNDIMRSKRTAQRKPGAQQPANPKLASACKEAMEVLLQGAEETGPHLPPVRNGMAAVTDVMKAIQRYAEGQIGAAELEVAVEKLKQQFPALFPTPPKWLPADFAIRIPEAIHAVEADHPDAAAEFIAWIRCECHKLRGRPPDERLTEVYREAARMKLGHKSWKQIADQLCPQKQEDTHHECTVACKNRIRVGAMRYLNNPER